MLHVAPQPEPADFDRKVRQKGLAHLREKGFDLEKPLPTGAKIQPYWRDCMDELHSRYDGICAYLAIYICPMTGASTTDHFIAKSSQPGLAYEWNNYRLACARMNSRKNDFDDVLDPFEIESGYFQLNLVTGEISPSKELSEPLQQQVQATITRLSLDDSQCCNTRKQLFDDCFIHQLYDTNYLKKRSPFIWYEANRQGLL